MFVRPGLLYQFTDRLHVGITYQYRRNEFNVHPRRYFYPSLNTLPYVHPQCPVSESIANRILCLPLYPGLNHKSVKNIAEVVNA
jgi:dTDP-4-amino-4,6-dideoxygalactose transaminase